MYVLNRDAFRAVDLNCVMQFVECWERYYLPGNDGDEEYFKQLNVGSDLAEQNIVQLLRWKDPRMLTHPRKHDGRPNPRVMHVLKEAGSINRFRNGEISVDEYESITQRIFPTGLIWQLFLFHLARPAEWPIADQHVFRSYSVLFNAKPPDSTHDFGAYADRFCELADRLRVSAGIDDGNMLQIVKVNKRLDNALWAFGRFVDTYDR